ncbi:MAG: hypothetical protein Q9167_000857 [Letrouitia subvulpina]
MSGSTSDETYDTRDTKQELPALQAQSALEDYDQMRPLSGDVMGSFDLVAPAESNRRAFSLETRSEQLFSHDHLRVIFSNPTLLLRFTAFLSTHRPQSVPVLIYYLDALKALKAIKYANAIAEALSPIPSHGFTAMPPKATVNLALEGKAAEAFDVLVKEDLPAYITHLYIQIVSLSVSQRITGVLAPHLREASEGLAEVFCLTDPSRPDNPIVFASEDESSRRIPLYEPFDDSAIVRQPRPNQQLVTEYNLQHDNVDGGLESQQDRKDEFQELSEMLNMGELETVRKWGGRMHRDYQEEDDDRSSGVHRPRLLLKEPTADPSNVNSFGSRGNGRLSGIYQNYLLIRPYPSLRILFASPTLRVPGILQSPFMNKIGGSSRVRDELTAAFAEGRGVTAKVRWVPKADEDGRNRWIHCTPLMGSTGQIGVWMIVLVDDDQGVSRRWKQAPPVRPQRGKVYGLSRDGQDRSGSLDDGLSGGGSNPGSVRAGYTHKVNHRPRTSMRTDSLRSSSPHSVRI